MKIGIKTLQKNKFFLKKALMITSVFLVVIMFLMLFIVYNNINTSKEQSLETVDKSMKSIYISSEAFFDSYFNQLSRIITGSNTTIFATKDYNDELFFYGIKDLASSLSLSTSLVNSIDSIYLYSKHKDYIITPTGTSMLNTFEDMGWFNESFLKNNESKILFRNIPEKGQMLTLLYTMDNSSTKNITGIMNIDLSKHFESYKNEEYCVLFFNNDTINYKSNYDFNNEQALTLLKKANHKSNIVKNDGKYYAISTKQSRYGDFSYGIIEVLPNYQLSLTLKILVFVLAFLFILALIFLIFCYYVDVSYRPILEISDILEHPYSKNTKEYLENDEITKKIANNIISLVTINEKLESELNKKTKIFEYAQLKALQWQMNPHFIFNTLNMLHMMSLDKNADKNFLSEAIYSLSKLMRYYLKTEKMTVTLMEEISMTEEYLKIIRARNGDKFKVTFDVDSSLLDKEVTKMCIQPILENCFKYGIANSKEIPEINISAKQKDDFFIISIQDNFSEITENTTNELNALFEEDVEIPEQHIGLNNINARIVLMYGKPCGLKVENRLPKKGLTVYMKFPF